MDLKRKRMGGHGLDSSASVEKYLVGSCEHGNKTSVPTKFGKIFD